MNKSHILSMFAGESPVDVYSFYGVYQTRLQSISGMDTAPLTDGLYLLRSTQCDAETSETIKYVKK